MNQRRNNCHYIEHKRDKNDYCNICGQKRALTWDHVPPKAVAGKYNTIVNTIFEGIPTENRHMREYQNGIRFRSICADCNNRLLGQYDVAYLDMVNKIEQLINRAASGRNHIILNDADTINVQINRICKAICGHLLSAKDEYDNETSIDKRLRKYVLEPEAIPDEKYRLFCWFYPYNTKIVLRDVVVIENHCNMTAPEGTISIMQSYPVAFLLTSQNEKDLGMIDLFKYATTDIDERVDLPFKWSSCFYPNTSLIRHYVWPCNIGNDSYSAAGVFGGKSIDSSRIGVAKRKVK